MSDTPGTNSNASTATLLAKILAERPGMALLGLVVAGLLSQLAWVADALRAIDRHERDVAELQRKHDYMDEQLSDLRHELDAIRYRAMPMSRTPE